MKSNIAPDLIIDDSIFWNEWLKSAQSKMFIGKLH